MPTTRRTTKLVNRWTQKAAHSTAELQWKTASAGGILPPLVQLWGGDPRPLGWARSACSGPEGPAAGPKGPHASEASDEPRSGEEPVPEATH